MESEPLPRSNSAVYRFLRRHATGDAEKANILCLFGGKYCVPDASYQTFLELYAKDAGKYAMGLIERKTPLFPFFIDVDFAPGDPNELIKSLKMILQVLCDEVMYPFLMTYANNLSISDPETTARSAVIDECRISHRQLAKYHVIFPKLVVDCRIAQFLTCCLQTSLSNEVPDVQWTKVIDISVMKKNGLRMLGAYKMMDVEGLYYVPCTLDWDTGTIMSQKIDSISLQEHSVRLFEVKKGMINLSNIILPSQESEANETPPKSTKHKHCSQHVIVPLETLRRVVMSLPPDYYGSNSYAKWSKVIWGIKNLSLRGSFEEEGRKLAHTFSRQSTDGYNTEEVDRLWDRARLGGDLLGWRFFLQLLKQEGLLELYSEVQHANHMKTQNQWKRSELLELLRYEVEGIDESCQFDFTQDTIKFKCGNIEGHVNKRDLSIYIGEEFKSYLAQSIPVPGTLSLLHKDISDKAQFNVNFDQDDDSAVLSGSNALITWYHPWKDESFITVSVEGAKKGNPIQKKKTIQYLQRRVEDGIQQYLQGNFGITVAHFQNCTINVNFSTSEDKRHAEGILMKMLLTKHPELKDVWRFAPDVKSNNCSGLYGLDPDKKTWVQKHNSAVETCLRSAFMDVPNMTLEDIKYIQTRRGISDLRCEFAASVLDPEFVYKLDMNLDIFALANGVYDLNERRFRDARPQDYIRIHADWKYSKEEAVKYRRDVEEFISRILPVVAERVIVLTYTAGLLSGRRFIKKLIALTDKRAGNNGKTTWINFLKCFFGSYAKSNNKIFNKGSFDQDLNSHDGGYEPLMGIRLVLLEELKRTLKLDEGLVKRLTGGPNVDVEGRKCGSSENFRFVWQSGFYMVFNEGDCPQFDTADEAFVTRLIVAPMRSKFVGAESPELAEPYTFVVDKNICDKFVLWRSAFLDILCEHYALDITEESIPSSMKEWREEIRDSCNSIGEWLETVVEPTDKVEDFVKVADLKTLYSTKPPKDFTRDARSWFKTKPTYVYKDSDNIRVDGSKKYKKERNVIRYCRIK